MKKTLNVLFLVFMVLSLVLAACGPTNNGGGNEAPAAEAPAEEAPADDAPMVPDPVVLTIGHTTSVTGKYETSSGRQFSGFALWMEEVNAAGGIVLSDGTVVTFEEVFYDDESSSDRVQELYTRLATEDESDFLISPYSSGLTGAAGVIAEQYDKIMIAAGAASDSIFNQGLTNVFQLYTPSSRYLNGAVDLLASAAPDVTKVAFIYENDKFATDVVTVASAYAAELGYDVVLVEGYDSDTTDFGPFINKIEETGAQAVLGGGHFQDGSTFARQLYEKETDIGFFALLVAPPEPDFALLGEAAFGVVGPSQWEPLAAFSEEAAMAAGYAWIGPSSADFVSGYEAAYGEEPSYHSGGGYAAGLMLQQAIVTADSVEPAAVKAALNALDVMTFFGYFAFDTTEDYHGLQIGHSMVYIQWQRDGDTLVKQVVWPLEGASEDAIYPIR